MCLEFWPSVGAVISFIANISTFGAFIVALIAVRQWKENEKSKAFQKYVSALTVFQYEIKNMPSSITSETSTDAMSNETKFIQGPAISSFSPCIASWAECIPYQPSDASKEQWERLEKLAMGYFYRKENKNELQTELTEAVRVMGENTESFWKKKRPCI